MKSHVVRQGEHVEGLAFRYGFSASEVWNHSKNIALRNEREHMNVLAPGDLLQVPEPATQRMSLNSGSRNRFKATVPEVTFDVIFRTRGGEALANECYEIHGIGAVRTGATDGEGKTSFRLPITASELDVVFPEIGISIRVAVGHMDPFEEHSGVRKRLENLGYMAPHALEDETLSAAVLAFQHDYGLEETGTLNDATRNALRDEHGH